MMYLRQAPSGMYHVRIRVPADAQPILRRAELHCSLGTRNRREAEQRARPIITRMRTQIFKARAKVSSDTYRSEILRAQAESLGDFDAMDAHFEDTHPQHSLEQLQQFIAQLMAPQEHPPSEPVRTALSALSDGLSPFSALLDHNETLDLAPGTIRQRRTHFEDFMHHQHAEGRYFLEHVTPDHWQSWCRSLTTSGLTNVTIRLKQTNVRSVIRDYLTAQGRTFQPHQWASIALPKAPRSHQTARRDANSPLTLPRWQEIYDAHLAHNREDEADIWALGLLTGARVGEILHIDSSQIDLSLNEWRIPHSKSLAGVRMVPLTPMAHAIVEARLMASPNGQLFEQRSTPEATGVLWRSRCDAARKKAGAKPRVETQHSTRSTFRTLAPRMAPNDTPSGVIEAIMGHELGGQIASATKHYLRAFEPDAHAFMAHWRPDITIRQSRA